MIKKTLLVAVCGMMAGFAWADAQAETTAEEVAAKPAVCVNADKTACVKDDAEQAAPEVAVEAAIEETAAVEVAVEEAVEAEVAVEATADAEVVAEETADEATEK